MHEEIVRFDDWTTLCNLLHEHATEALAPFGFPDRHRHIVERSLQQSKQQPSTHSAGDALLSEAATATLGISGAYSQE